MQARDGATAVVTSIYSIYFNIAALREVRLYAISAASYNVSQYTVGWSCRHKKRNGFIGTEIVLNLHVPGLLVGHYNI